MKVQQLNPRTLIQEVVSRAEQELQRTAGGKAEITGAEAAGLPSELKGVADRFVGAGEAAPTADILQALRTGLEQSLAKSLAAGQLLREELNPGLVRLFAQTSVGVQVQALLSAGEPLSVADAEQTARAALARADASVPAQLEVYRALSGLRRALERDEPGAPHAAQLRTLVEDRAKLMRDSANQAVKDAEAALKAGAGDAQRAVAAALQAAHDVYSTVSPKSSRLKTLQKRAGELGVRLGNDAAQARPFFARFLENQNRQAAPIGQQAPGVVTTKKFPSDAEDNGGDGGGGVVTTMKAPSDNEDGGDGGGVVTTMKAPSDNEDGGEGVPRMGGGAVTEKFPSDAEDGGADQVGGGSAVTEKFPSDAEDGGADQVGGGADQVGGGGAVTKKFPSDAEDGGAGEPGDVAVTMKFPSDAEDGGPDPLGGGAVTEKYPSDAEDGGAGEPGDVVMTRKFPSDAEDGGADPLGGGGAITEKYPSDAEDGGAGDVGGGVTERYPSDNEDGGADGPGDVATTMKFPSDAEDGDAGAGDTDRVYVTMKFPSDNEDGGDGGAVVTERYPSDNEDGGVDGAGDATTAKFPSDNEDGGDDAGRVYVTMKYPSDNEDGGDGGAVVTEKYPSDNEDAGPQ